MLCCGAVARCASYDAHLATAPQHIPTQHDMLPQHLVCKYELNCEHCNIIILNVLLIAQCAISRTFKIIFDIARYNNENCNITLARSKAPWWWSDKIETCRSVLKCFMWNYMCIRWLINLSDSTKMHGAAIRFINFLCSWVNLWFFNWSNDWKLFSIYQLWKRAHFSKFYVCEK